MGCISDVTKLQRLDQDLAQCSAHCLPLSALWDIDGGRRKAVSKDEEDGGGYLAK